MKKIFPALMLAALSLLTLSCVKERETDYGIPKGTDQAEVILRLKTPSGYSPATRSLTFAQENTINDVYVLVFDKNNTLTAIKKGENVTSSEGSASPSYSGEGSFTVTLEASKTPDDTYKLVVLANAQAVIYLNTIGFDVAAVSNKSYASVMAEISGQISGQMYPTGGTIPMWGESGQIVVAVSGNHQTLQLTRSVARIDVGVGKPSKDAATDVWSWDGEDASSTAIPFVLNHVYVIKPNDRYAVAPDKTKLAGEPTVPAGTLPFTYADSESNFGFTATASATGGYTSRDIYVPEADIEMGSPASSGDANHTDRMAIVVGGYYDDSETETFYRLDFAVGGSLVNVLRNHLYQFNISKVSGDGHPDVETAYNSLSMNMTADILEWNETDMEHIVFDGQNYLSVSQDEFNFSRDEINTEQEDNVLYVKTDVPGGWSIEEIVYPDDEDEGWITLSSDSGVADNKTKVVLTVTENDTQQPRSAIIWIAAGRLRYQVTVNQSTTSALSLRVTDGYGSPVTELRFISAPDVRPAPQKITVSWQPKTASLTVTNTSFGTNAFPSEEGTPASGTVNNSEGEVSYTIQPLAIAKTEVAINPFLEKISKIDFAVSDGGSTMKTSIFLRQINYNLITDASTYMLDSQEKTIHVRANFPWRITDVSDPDNILSAQSEIDLKGVTGGYNTAMGDEVKFTMVALDEDNSKEGKTATITFLNLADNTTWPVTITATEYPYVGMFGGELKEDNNGEWQFTKPLYMNRKDEDGGRVEWLANSTSVTGANDDRDGRENTYTLATNYTSNALAAKQCYNKNTGTINSKDDLTWYLPAQKQLMAIWVAHESFGDYKLVATGGYTNYWSSTEHSDSNTNNSWNVYFQYGTTSGTNKAHTLCWVRCVREY